MRTLTIDTETSGLNNFKKPWDDPCQPAIVQLAALLTEGDEVRGSLNLIVIPNKPCEEGAAKVHGITQDVIEKFGVPPTVAIPAFNNLLKKADRTVYHNRQFDMNVISKAYVELGADPSTFRAMPSVCTMLSTMYHVNIRVPGKSQPKWTKLIEAYKHFVDPNGFDGAHDAMNDVFACWKILRALEKLGLPLTC